MDKPVDVVHNCWGNLFNKNSQNKHIDEKIDYNKQSEREDQRRENMNIKIISVGKLKEKYLIQGINEYVKRLNAYAKIKLIEVPDEKAPENLSEAQMRQVKEKEGERILAKIKEQEYVYALAIEGKNPTSESFAKQIDQLGIQGKSHLVFVIGGSLGLSEAVMKRSNAQISFGKMTYPHQLMRLIIVEQIYRAFRINAGAPYHK